jgi:hypothetical protein
MTHRQGQGGSLRAAPPCDALRELRLQHCQLTADDAASLMLVAGRLRVLHLTGWVIWHHTSQNLMAKHAGRAAGNSHAFVVRNAYAALRALK